MRAVIDTNVVFEGVTAKGGAAGMVIDAWIRGEFEPFVSTTLAYEYRDVLARKLGNDRWIIIRPMLIAMFRQAVVVDIFFTWRPASPDRGDDHVIDCAMNANAPIVTENVRDFKLAQRSLGMAVMTPAEFLARLR